MTFTASVLHQSREQRNKESPWGGCKNAISRIINCLICSLQMHLHLFLHIPHTIVAHPYSCLNHPSKHSSRNSTLLPQHFQPNLPPIIYFFGCWIPHVWTWGEVSIGLIRTKHNDYINKFLHTYQVYLTLSSATQVKNQQNSLTKWLKHVLWTTLPS